MKGIQKSNEGFTLLELLVVIAIIAILAALLLPALSGAKNRSAKTVDLNNLRQIMISVHIYAADNNDVLTRPNWDFGSSPDGIARMGWLYTPDLAATGTNIFHAETGALWNSVQNGKIFLCPIDRTDQALYSRHYEKVVQREQQISSYIMNGAVDGFRFG